MILRHITVSEVRQAVLTREVIEDYPDDKYGPTCLILGFTEQDRSLHVQCSHATRAIITVVTVYEPDPDEWHDLKVRID